MPPGYTASGCYLNLYKAYCNDTTVGKGYSNNFSVENNANAWAAIIVNTVPAHITINTERTSLVANGSDTITVSAYVTDALNHPVSPNTPIRFTINNGVVYSTGMGSWSGQMGNTTTVGTINGYATASFGWVDAAYAGDSSNIIASSSYNNNLNDSIRIAFVGSQPDASWTKSFGGTDYEEGRSVCAINDGYVITGQDFSNNSDLYLVKADLNGNLIWNRTFGGLGFDFGTSVVATSDGYVATGYTDSYGNLRDVYLIKTDFDGHLVWNRTFGGKLTEEGYCLIAVEDGFVIAGFTNSNSNGTGKEEVYLVKTNWNGNLIWNRTFDTTNSERGYSVVNVSDGYVVTGTTRYGNGSYGMFLMKTDLNGNLVWKKTYGETYARCGYSVAAASDGYIIAGYTDMFCNGTSDAILVKTDLNGNHVWNKTYGGPNAEHSFSVAAASDGYVIAGNTHILSTLIDNLDVYVVKTDLNGDLVWEKTYGGDIMDSGYSVVTVSDGYVVAGYKSDRTTDADIYIIKIDRDAPTSNGVSFNVNLFPGWNLVSFPVNNNTLHASDLVSNTSLGVDMVAVYNNTTGAYTTYYTGAAAWKNVQLTPDRGYFIHSTKRSSFSINGEQLSPHYINIYRGWNMVGWSSQSDVKASEILGRISLSMVSRYNAGAYQTFYSGASASKNFTLTGGEGYFLRSETSTVQQLYIG